MLISKPLFRPEPEPPSLEGLEGRSPDSLEGREEEEAEEDGFVSSPSNMDVFISVASVRDLGMRKVSNITYPVKITTINIYNMGRYFLNFKLIHLI